jgi:hypothetical protein
MPTNQTKVLNDSETSISQSLSNRGGSVLYTGMNSKGEYFIGKKKFNAATGDEIQTVTIDPIVSDFDTLTVNNLIVNTKIDASTATAKIKSFEVTGISTISNSTQSTSKTTGALIVSGGVGIGSDLNVGGDITAFATSDQRLKDNIVPIPNALNKVLSISGNTFDWNEKSGKEGKEAGVIAQEILEVLPEAVTTRDNGYLAVRYEKLVPLLIEAIKELKGQIEELKGGN